MDGVLCVDVMLLMGYCVRDVWCWCVNGASPVECLLSLFYLCAFQMKPV